MFLSEATIGRMKALHTEALMDRAVLLRFLEGVKDKYGLDRPESYREWGEVACLFRPEGQAKEGMELTEAPAQEARIRVKLGTAVYVQDRFRLTHLHGHALDKPLVYEVIGEPKTKYSSIVMRLALVVEAN
jgi:hypothetical protein